MKKIKSSGIFIIRIIFYGLLVSLCAKPMPAAFGQSAKEGSATAAQKEDLKIEDMRDPFKSYFDTTPDTFQPGFGENAPAAVPPNLRIQGIIWGGSFPQAIVNNKVVKEGDLVEGVKVISIKNDALTLSFMNKEYKLASPASDNLKNLKKKSKGGRNEKKF